MTLLLLEGYVKSLDRKLLNLYVSVDELPLFPVLRFGVANTFINQINYNQYSSTAT